MSLLAQLRKDGIAMRGSYPPMEITEKDENDEPVTVIRQRWIGWTADEAKAEAAREAGATVVTYTSRDPRFNGWEVSVNEAVDAS